MKNRMKMVLCSFAIWIVACSSIKDDAAGVTITGNTASISGHVILDDGRALSKKLVASNPIWDSTTVSLAQVVDTGVIIHTQLVDSEGGFEFEDLSAGTYSLQAKLPSGELFTRMDILLKEGESLVINLGRRLGSSADSLVVWELEITCGDSAWSRCIFYGPWNPGIGVNVRFLEQPWEIIGLMVPGKVARGTKIAIRFPEQIWETDSSIQILVGIAGREGALLERLDVENGVIYKDSIPNRRLRVTWGNAGPECELLDSEGVPAVTCKAYVPPQYSSMSEISSEIGNIFRDIANDLGASESVEGYLFPDSVVRGGGEGAFYLLDQKQYYDTTTSEDKEYNNPEYRTSLDRQFFDSIPIEVFEGLNADSLVKSFKIGSQLNTHEYWNDVPGVFYDPFVTPFIQMVVPFDSTEKRNYEAEGYAHYKSFHNLGRPVVSLRKYKDWALVSQGDMCTGGYYYLVRREESGIYHVVHHWNSSTWITCD